MLKFCENLVLNSEVQSKSSDFVSPTSRFWCEIIDKVFCDDLFQKLPTDKAYYIAKEFLMTERTYHKDLGIVINHFREYMALEESSQPTLSRLYETLQPLYSSHCRFLDELERRMSQCETRISESLTVDIGDLVCDHFSDLEVR